MAVDSGSMGKQKNKDKDSQDKENKPAKSERVIAPEPKRRKSPGVRVIHGRIYDSDNGKTCHQCRQKTRDLTASCKNQRNGKPCTLMFCHKCLLNRYGEKAEEVAGLVEWSCPKCRDICNCSFCMKKKGCQPTGLLVKTAKASGYSSVSEMLLRGGEQSNPENATPDTLNLSTKDTLVSPKETETVNPIDEKEGTVLPNIDSKECTKLVKVTQKRKALDTVKETGVDVSNDGANGIDSVANKPKKARNDVIEKNTEPVVTETANISVSHAEIPLPVGKDLMTVAGTEVPAQDVGNALHFSEFCAVFGEFLNVKKGRAHHVLQDIFHGRTGRTGKISTTVQFVMDLLSVVKEEQGQRSSELTLSGESWFRVLKEYLSNSQGVLAAHGLACLDELANFETFNASQKLRLLNVLCDEVLGTEKVRNWIEEQNEEFADCVKEAKEKLRAAKDEENTLKKQLGNDIAAAIVAKNGASLSIEEHAAIVSRANPEIEIARAKVLESNGHIMNYAQYPDAVRAESIFIDQGHAYWRLNISGKGNVLCQQIGKGDQTDTLNEKWSSIDTEEKEVIEKHACFVREKQKAEKRAKTKAMKEHKRIKEAPSVVLPE